jgi:D-amino-acid dehydrogenase
MQRFDAIVLGAGIVGTCTALHLAKHDLAVALVDRSAPGEGTSYGNAGVIGGAGVYPTPFPRHLKTLVRIALQQAPEAHYHWSALPHLAPWLLAYFANSTPAKLEENARLLRPIMAAAVDDHAALLAECGASDLLRRNGWLSLYAGDEGLAQLQPQLELGRELGKRAEVLDVGGTLALEPALAPRFRHAVLWPDIASVSDPLAVTQAYAARLQALGGRVLIGDARRLRKTAEGWDVATDEGTIAARDVVIALGPWAPAVLEPLGIKLPLAVKRGYHMHYRARGNAVLNRPVLDTANGFVLAPMRQGIRLTTGAEFADRDAPATPVQIERVLPAARELFPLGEALDAKAWMGARPCFPDMQPGLWLNYGHNHFGLTLAPTTGRLLAEMMTGAQPFTDPAPYAAGRFAGA